MKSLIGLDPAVRVGSSPPPPLPVALLVAEIIADLVHDGGARQDVGLVLLLGIVGFHDDDDPVDRAVAAEAVLPACHVLLHRPLVCLRVLEKKRR